MHRFEGILARYTRCLGPIQSRNQRVTRVELATFSLATRRSTTELHPHFCLPAAAFSEGWRGRQIMSNRPRGATFNCCRRLEIVESKQGPKRILQSNHPTMNRFTIIYICSLALAVSAFAQTPPAAS